MSVRHVDRRGSAAAAAARAPTAGLSLAMLLSSLGTSISNVALPNLAEAFAATMPSVQWVVLAYLIALTAAVVGAGRLGDLLGRRAMLIGGTALFTIASLLCAAAPTLGLLVAARALQGIGAAAMMALAVALAAQAPKGKAGAAIGLLGTMSALGTGLGPLVGGLLVEAFGWPAIYLVLAPPGLVALLLVHRLPGDAAARREGPREAFDYPGALLLTLALSAYALAMSSGGGGFGALNLLLLAAAALAAGSFLSVERRAQSPLIRLELFRDALLRRTLAASALVATVMMGMMVAAPFYLSRALGVRAAVVGAVLAAGPIVAAMTAAPAGRVADRIGARPMAVLGLAAILAACAGLVLMPIRFGVAGFMAALVAMTFGYAVFQTSNNMLAMTAVDPTRRGLVSGILSLSRNLGLITGASAMGAVFLFGAGASDPGSAPPQAAATGLHATFAVAAVLMLVALAVMLKASRARSEDSRRARVTA
ncbi:MAG TPA: MFS transporter [Allosphingosinicella sp.]|jgi:MFS family permease